MSAPSNGDRWCRLLIRCYPRGFREEYGADIVELWRQQRRDESRWRFVRSCVRDLIVSLPVEHLEAYMRRPRQHGSVSEHPASEAWWKLAVAGPLLVLAVILAAAIGVEAWFLGMAVVMVAAVVTAAGLVLGLVRWSGRRSRSLPA